MFCVRNAYFPLFVKIDCFWFLCGFCCCVRGRVDVLDLLLYSGVVLRVV